MARRPFRYRILVVSFVVCILSLLGFNIVTLMSLRKLDATSRETAAAVGDLDFTVQSMGNDLADARNVLGLKTNSYMPEGGPETDGSKSDDFESYYSAVDQLMADFNESMLKKGCSYFLESKECLDIYKKYSLSPVQKGSEILLLNSGYLYYKLIVQPYSAGGKTVLSAESFDRSTSAKVSDCRELASFIEANNSRIQAHYAALGSVAEKLDQYSKNQQILSYLRSHKLYVKKKVEDYASTGFDVRRSDGSILCGISLDMTSGKLTMGNLLCQNVEEIRANLLKIETLFDVRTVSEKKAGAKFGEISALVKDSAFIAYMESKGCSIASVPEETEESYDFAITDKGGFKVGSLSLEKDTGEVYLFDRDNVLISSVKKN